MVLAGAKAEVASLALAVVQPTLVGGSPLMFGPKEISAYITVIDRYFAVLTTVKIECTWTGHLLSSVLVQRIGSR